MKVDGVILQGEQVFKAKMPVSAQLEVEEIPQDSPPTAQIDEPSPTEPQSDIQSTDDTEDGKGVLGMLQEGHFKGVSNVRLHINFFEQLSAIEAGKLQAVTEQKVNAILESVGGIVDTFLAAEENEQTDGVSELQESFVQAVSGYPNEPVTEFFLNNAFDDFVEALRDLFAPPALTQAEDIPTDTESSGAPELPWQTFIEDLRSAFTTARDELTQAFAEVRIFPEFSEPNGNGVAYEKFLAIYNELGGLQTPSDEQPGSEPLDSAV